MKILVISPRVYPQDYNPNGNNFLDHTRALDIIQESKLNKNDKISLLILNSPTTKFKFNKIVKIFQIKRKFTKPNIFISKILFRLGMAIPDFFSSLYTFSPNFLFDTKKIIDQHDTIYFTTSTAIFPIIYARLKNKHIITDPFGSFFQLSLRNIYATKIYLYPLWLIRLIFAYIIEGISFYLSNKVIVFNQEHLNYFKKLYFLPNKIFFILPIKMVTTFRPNPKKIFAYKNKYNLKDTDKVILFIGNFTIPQNLLPLNQVIKAFTKLPKIFKLLVIGGTNDNPQSTKQITYGGFVQDLENVIPLSAICLAPTLQGSGVKTKILLYLLANKPVLTTPQGANFLPPLDDVLIGQIETQITSKYLNSIVNRKYTTGKNYVLKCFSKKTFCQKITKLFQF